MLKLEDNDGAKGEETEKERRDGRERGAETKVFGTNIKKAVARVKSLNSSMTRGSRGTTGSVNASEKSTSNTAVDGTSVEYMNGIPEKQSNDGLPQTLLTNLSLLIVSGINSRFDFITPEESGSHPSDQSTTLGENMEIIN